MNTAEEGNLVRFSTEAVAVNRRPEQVSRGAEGAACMFSVFPEMPNCASLNVVINAVEFPLHYRLFNGPVSEARSTSEALRMPRDMFQCARRERKEFRTFSSAVMFVV